MPTKKRYVNKNIRDEYSDYAYRYISYAMIIRGANWTYGSDSNISAFIESEELEVWNLLVHEIINIYATVGGIAQSARNGFELVSLPDRQEHDFAFKRDSVIPYLQDYYAVYEYLPARYFDQFAYITRIFKYCHEVIKGKLSPTAVSQVNYPRVIMLEEFANTFYETILTFLYFQQGVCDRHGMIYECNEYVSTCTHLD